MILCATAVTSKVVGSKRIAMNGCRWKMRLAIRQEDAP
jgi:hypothetical protein